MAVTIDSFRQKILDLAMRGKLVKQNPIDESVDVLMERINEEKQLLIRKGKLKKQKPLPLITREEEPYELPDGWRWTRLIDISIFIDYRGKTPNKTTEGLRLITAKNVKKGYISSFPPEFIDPEDYDSWMTRGIPNRGDLLFTTEAPLGNVALINTNEKFALAQRIIAIQFLGNIDKSFTLYAFLSPQIQKLIEDEATGVTAKGIKASKLKEITIPIPPLEEQKRISRKIDALFDYCDKLEQQSEKQQAYLSALREKVLDDAMKGLLVEQDENDESAEALLEKIEAEKALLIVEKKIKKQKALPAIEQGEIPYDLPKGWNWVRLGELIELISGRDLTQKDFNNDEKGIPYIMGASNIIDGRLQIERWTEHPTVIGRKGDLLISVKGTVGKMVFQEVEEAHLSRQIMGLRFLYSIEPKYVFYFLQTHIVHLQSVATSFIPGISRDDILLSKIPLPPLKEQKRIVEKVERMFAYIDELESQMVLPK